MNTGRWQLIEPVFKAILMHFIEKVIVLCFYTFYVEFYYMFHWIVSSKYTTPPVKMIDDRWAGLPV